MTLTSVTAPTTRLSAPRPPVRHELLSLETEWADAWQVRIMASGEVDAGNADRLAEYVFRRAANSCELILDLRMVTFFAIEGFPRLQKIDFRCQQASVKLNLIPGEAVSRVLALCDPQGTLRHIAA